MFNNLISESSVEGGPCSNVYCRSWPQKLTKALYYNRLTRGWVCLQCAQTENKEAMWKNRPKVCINAKELTFELLSN